MIRRKNRSSGFFSKSYKSKAAGNPENMYREWHWGVNPNPEPIEVDDSDYPDVLIECGRLVEFTYRPIGGNIKRKDRLYKLSKTDSNKTHLVFNPYHEFDKLYIVCTDSKAKKTVANDLYKTNPFQSVPLADISYHTGGRHMGEDYPDIDAKAIGILTTIVYACEKKGDGYSFYVHKMGEESGIQPIIAVSKDGRLWIAGGNYTAPIQGITD
jgi:hypothetical protein